MEEDVLQPDVVSYNTAISACAGRWAMAWQHFCKMQKFCQVMPYPLWCNELSQSRGCMPRRRDRSQCRQKELVGCFFCIAKHSQRTVAAGQHYVFSLDTLWCWKLAHGVEGSVNDCEWQRGAELCQPQQCPQLLQGKVSMAGRLCCAWKWPGGHSCLQWHTQGLGCRPVVRFPDILWTHVQFRPKSEHCWGWCQGFILVSWKHIWGYHTKLQFWFVIVGLMFEPHQGIYCINTYCIWCIYIHYVIYESIWDYLWIYMGLLYDMIFYDLTFYVYNLHCMMLDGLIKTYTFHHIKYILLVCWPIF